MRHHPLAELVQEAERIFVGVCVSVGDGTLSQPGGGGIPYTEYTFEVRDALKGSPGKSLTIRQYGVRAPRPTPDGTRALVTRARGMPVYQPGQELLLFLIGDSSLGLTSPVGLDQGAFRLITENGKKRAVNGFNNVGLFRGMSPASVSAAPLPAEESQLLGVEKGPLDLDPFLSLVRKMAGK